MGNTRVRHGQFQCPFQVAVDSAGDVYVTDINGNNPIQKFTNLGYS